MLLASRLSDLWLDVGNGLSQGINWRLEAQHYLLLGTSSTRGNKKD